MALEVGGVVALAEDMDVVPHEMDDVFAHSIQKVPWGAVRQGSPPA